MEGNAGGTNIFTMKKIVELIFIALACATLSCFSACSSDEPDSPGTDNPGTIAPDKPVPDPTGTVTMRLRHDTKAELGNLIMTADCNFHCNYGQIACIGKVSGLGNVTAIPKSGWSKDMAIEIGKGYVYYDSYDDRFYRIYTVSWLNPASDPDALVGVEIKYQQPFSGVDEAITVEDTNIVFTGEGGNQTIKFTNSSIIPSTVTVNNNCDWCSAYKFSSLNNGIYDGINLYVQSTDNPYDEASTDVTIETLSGRKTTLKVTRMGRAPYIHFSDGKTELELDGYYNGGNNYAFEIYTNLDPESINITPSVDWIHIDNVSRYREFSRVYFSFEANNTAVEREGSIILTTPKDAQCKAIVTIKQNATSFAKVPQKVYFDKTQQYITIDLPAPGVDVESDAQWCQTSIDGYKLLIGVDATSTDRTTNLKLAEGSYNIEVIQSKYTVGDVYNENGVKGTVIKMDGANRLIRSDLLGQAKYSTETKATGANSGYNGESNFMKIKAIPKWEEYYPAFALCDALNVNGVTGWYMPAINEICWESSATDKIWSSTEYNIYNAFTSDRGYNGKLVTYSVYAIRHF